MRLGLVRRALGRPKAGGAPSGGSAGPIGAKRGGARRRRALGRPKAGGAPLWGSAGPVGAKRGGFPSLHKLNGLHIRNKLDSAQRQQGVALAVGEIRQRGARLHIASGTADQVAGAVAHCALASATSATLSTGSSFRACS